MNWYLAMLLFLYLALIALYGQWKLAEALIDWLDPKIKRWIKRRSENEATP